MKQIALYDKDELIQELKAIIVECLGLKENEKEKQKNEDILLRVKDIAREFGLSESTIYRYVREGIFPSFKIKGGRYFRSSEIQAVMHKRYNL